MGEIELVPDRKQLIIHSVLFFYGDAANDLLSKQIAEDIQQHWNEPNGKVVINNVVYNVEFNMEGVWAKNLSPEMIYENDNPRNNYFRLEEFASGNISFVDAINSNTGYFKLDNLLNNSTTAAHEYGHTIGLDHPEELDIRGKGTPGIMFPRGSIVDPPFQYNPQAIAGDNTNGGTMNPFTRKVTQADINNLRLSRINFNNSRFATIGDFSSIWHDKHQP
jgi:hypothetical protein